MLKKKSTSTSTSNSASTISISNSNSSTLTTTTTGGNLNYVTTGYSFTTAKYHILGEDFETHGYLMEQLLL